MVVLLSLVAGGWKWEEQAQAYDGTNPGSEQWWGDLATVPNSTSKYLTFDNATCISGGSDAACMFSQIDGGGGVGMHKLRAKEAGLYAFDVSVTICEGGAPSPGGYYQIEPQADVQVLFDYQDVKSPASPSGWCTYMGANVTSFVDVDHDFQLQFQNFCDITFGDYDCDADVTVNAVNIQRLDYDLTGVGGSGGSGLSAEDSHKLDLVWWGVWGMLGLMLVLIMAPRWFRVFGVTHGG